MRWKVACLGLLAGIAVATTILLDGSTMPPPSAVATADATMGRSSVQSADLPGASGSEARAGDPNGGTADTTTSAPRRTAATEPGLSGVVLDDLGAPIPRVLVYLRLVDSRIAGAETCCTDGDGYFVFRQAAGRCVLSVENELIVGHAVTMALGERRFVELRASQPCIVLEGFVRAGTGPVSGRVVRAVGGNAAAGALECTDGEGFYQHVLLPGRYVLTVDGAAAGEDEATVGASTSTFGKRTLTLDAFTRRVRHDFELPSASFRVTVIQARDRRPVVDAVVRAIAGPRTRHARTDAAGVAVFSELTTGTWRVTVGTQALAMAKAQEVEVRATDRMPQAVTLLVESAGAIRVTTRWIGGAAAAQPGKLLSADLDLAAHTEVLRLHLEGGEVRQPFADDITNPTLGAGGDPLPFGGVPSGRHELRCADKIDASGCVFAPCEPFRQSVDVRAGEVTVVEVAAVRRPRLEVLVGVVDSLALTIPVKVVGSRGVVAMPTIWGRPTMFASPVAPGDYKVLVDGPNGRIEETVTVGTVDVQHVVRVPGASGGVDKQFSPSGKR